MLKINNIIIFFFLLHFLCPQSPESVLKPTVMNNTDVFAPVGDAGPFAMRGHKQRCMSAVEPSTPSEMDLKDEEQDRFLGVPLRRYCPTRSSAHIRDSFRRHSWEPGKRLQEEESNYDELRYEGSVSIKLFAQIFIHRPCSKIQDPPTLSGLLPLNHLL